jgi:hypothetical protein
MRCTPCSRKHAKKNWLAAHPDYMREAQRKYYRAKRARQGYEVGHD